MVLQVELARNRGNEKDEESEKMMREMADRIETPTRVIGVTAVEDKLQANVARSITALREAKIQVRISSVLKQYSKYDK